jgi:DNA-directed RNA polymerase I subunit RPA2
MTRDQLVSAKEESTEFGGYFVCNGIERIIRMLILQRRHYIMGLKRGAYLKRGANYTPWATMIRCVRPDQSSATVRLHYLADGGVNFAFTMRKAEYFIPVGVLLKCFMEVRDIRLLPICIIPLMMIYAVLSNAVLSIKFIVQSSIWELLYRGGEGSG